MYFSPNDENWSSGLEEDTLELILLKTVLGIDEKSELLGKNIKNKAHFY